VKTIVVLGALALALGGCATVTRGSNDTWTVNTTPSGAAVKTTNQFFCESTPCTFKMPRRSDFDVTITKAGYKTWTGHVTHHVSGAGGAGMAGNVILGGIIGAGVDAYSGAMNDLVPNPLSVVLEQETVAQAAPVVPAAAPAQAAPVRAVAVARTAGSAPAKSGRAQPAQHKRCAVYSPDSPESVSC